MGKHTGRVLLSSFSACIMLFSACASKPQPFPETSRAAIQNQPELKAYHYGPVGLTVMTTGAKSAMFVGILFGAIGGGIGGAMSAHLAAVAGKETMAEYRLEDPIVSVKAQFLPAFADTFAVKPIEAIAEPVSKDDIEALKTRGITGLILDFKTIQWSMSSKSVDASISYQARVRFLQSSDGTVLWQEQCNVVDIPEHKPSDLETITAASIVRQRFITAAEKCASEILAKAKGVAPNKNNTKGVEAKPT